MKDVVSLVHGAERVRLGERKEETAESKPGNDVHQAQESSGPWLNISGGTGGVAGCPEHHPPRQGRGTSGTGSGLECPAKSRSEGPIRAVSCS